MKKFFFINDEVDCYFFICVLFSFLFKSEVNKDYLKVFKRIIILLVKFRIFYGKFYLCFLVYGVYELFFYVIFF